MGIASAYLEKASMMVRRYFLHDLTDTGPITSTYTLWHLLGGIGLLWCSPFFRLVVKELKEVLEGFFVFFKEFKEN